MSVDQTRAIIGTPDLRRRRVRLPIAAIVGIVIVIFWVVVAVIGPYITPHDRGWLVDSDMFRPTSWTLPLGGIILVPMCSVASSSARATRSESRRLHPCLLSYWVVRLACWRRSHADLSTWC